MDSASGQRDNNNIAKMYLSRMMSYFLSGLRTWNIMPLPSDLQVVFFDSCCKIYGVLGNIQTPQNSSDYHCHMSVSNVSRSIKKPFDLCCFRCHLYDWYHKP